MPFFCKYIKIEVMKFDELKTHISAGKLASVYILMGDDDYLIDAAKKLFLANVENKEFNYTVIPSDKPESVVDALNVYPFMSDYSVVEIDCDKEIPGLKKYLENPNKASVLILTVTKLDKCHKEILSQVEFVDCNRLGESALLRWIRAKMVSLGSNIEDEAAVLLVSYCNRMMSKISRETEKLAAYGFGKTITVRDVEALVTPDTDFKIFQLGEAAAKRDGNTALKIYRELASFEDPTLIFGAIYSHFRKLLYCALSPNEDLCSLLGIKEFVLKKMMFQSKAFGAVRLKNIVDGFHDLDFGMKNGTFADKTVSEGYLLKILNI